MTRTELAATIRNIVLALAGIALAILGGSAAGAGTAAGDPAGMVFTATAVIDTSDVVVIPGERWCPKVGAWGGTSDQVTWGKCLVGLVEGAPSATWRPDWDHAMLACHTAGFDVQVCLESVGDGEF